MGVNNKKRRATKKKAKRRRESPATDAWPPFVSVVTPEFARSYLLELVGEIAADPSVAARTAAMLLRADGPLPPSLAREGLRELLADLVRLVVGHGWRPTDLVQITGRRVSERHIPPLLGLLADEAARHPAERVAPAWRADLAAAGSPRPLDLNVLRDVQRAVELASCLSMLPAISVLLPAPGVTAGTPASAEAGDPKLLARVRALLAKAESTEFPDEAESLSAKAQELISRHALDRLLAHSDDGKASEATVARRIWIDQPYVFAKALLVGAVADANRCRSVASDQLGFCTVLGRGQDLDAVDLLVTSLLVQAHAAMLRFGSQADRYGTSRTRSFRQSFLVSYASRISERLHAAADEAVQGTGRSGELVPVLARQAEHVEAACQAMFPRAVTREARIGNEKGWAAGRAAADLALLDTDLEITAAAS